MVDGVKDWEFKRGLDNDFMDKLDVLRKSDWFAEVLADKDLLLGIRDNYLDIYRYGQRLFQITRVGAGLKVTTHPKYLVDPDLNRAVVFDGEHFVVADAKPLMEHYKVGKTLLKIKQAAKYYAGDEKMGVHRIIRENLDVLDLEIAFVRKSVEDEQQEKKRIDRIDIACLERLKDGVHLRFWEAKTNSNGDLRAAGDGEAKVIEQIKRYQIALDAHQSTTLESYQTIARNLEKISSWSNNARVVGPLVKLIASKKDTLVKERPQVGLIIFGYERAHQRDTTWQKHMTKLAGPGFSIRSAGNPASISL